MRFLTNTDARRWSDRAFWAGKKPWTGFRRQEFSIEKLDAGLKTQIARVLAKNLLSIDNHECLLTLTEWGVWESAECMPLAEKYRLSLGCTDPIIDVPGHCFDPSEQDLLFALLAMVLYFIWGCECVSVAGGWAIRISHDEYLEVITAKRGTSDEVLAELRGLGLKKL